MTAAAKKQTPEMQGESLPFSAEISKVLQLMIHSLYTNKDIFLRELISNASDACDKLRYQAIQNDALYGDDQELGIRIALDEKAKTITIADNGIGMNRDDLITNLGTIAKSGTEAFLSQMTGDDKKDVNLIGQFGVGFYASFMVADRVVVHSRKAGENESWQWESDGQGSFSVAEGTDHPRGTSITLHLKKEAKDYADFFRLKFIVETYSDHISFPIRLADSEGKDEAVNEAGAIWTRPKAEIAEEQYQAFYRHVSHSPDQPFLTLHNKAEGALEYTSLLFIPSMKPFDLFHPERKRRVKLYVKRVFITDEGVDLVPAWLRFLRGVVDSQDLPLNISRETLQSNPMLKKIRDAITKKLLGELVKKAEKDEAAYAGFWNNFGAVLKEGLCESDAPKDKIFEACRFYSTASEGLVSLKDYVSRMKEGQEAIYVINGDSVDALRRSAQIEGFVARGLEVLLLADHVDDFWLNVNPNYAEKPFRSVLRAGDDLNAFAAPESSESEAEKPKADDASIAALCEAMKTLYGDAVRQVRPTAKLATSPICLAVGEGDMDLRMERFLIEHKQLPRGMARIVEINPRHPVVLALAANPQGAAFEDRAWLLLDQAMIAEGEPIRDPAAFAARLNRLMA